MKRFLKILLLIFLIVGIVAIVGMLIGGFMIGGLFNPPINQGDAEKVLINDYDDICIIVDYMIKSDFSDISIESNDYVYDDGNYGTWYVYDEALETQDAGCKRIDDENVVAILDMLFKEKNYQNISKSGNTISFLLWTNLDEGRGIAYTLDGNSPTLQFLTKSEKLKKENWHYYEEDFNEWRLNQG